MTAAATARAWTALRDFARARPVAERCDLCGAPIDAGHAHLIDVETRRLGCACIACTHLLGAGAAARWTLVRHRAERRADIVLGDETWAALGLPIALAFVVTTGVPRRVVAQYPSPGGPVESAIPPEAWDVVLREHPSLRDLRPDVEALLVNRTGTRRDHYVVSIDVCYHLIGLLRAHWRGFSGGPVVRGRIEAFFAALEATGGA